MSRPGLLPPSGGSNTSQPEGTQAPKHLLGRIAVGKKGMELQSGHGDGYPDQGVISGACASRSLLIPSAATLASTVYCVAS